MRSYEELEANAYKKAEQIINESKRKKKMPIWMWIKYHY